MSQIASSNVPSADALVDKIQKLHQEIQSALRLSQQNTKRYYDNRHGPDPAIPIGTRVWLDATNIQTTAPSKKLADKRLGPFRVIQQISPLNYKLELPQTMKVHPVFHTNLLTVHKEDPIPGRTPPEPPPIEIEGEEEYEVEKILDARLFRRQRQYLVKWEGYSTTENSWEPIQNLEHASDIITDFHERHPNFTWTSPKRSSSKISGDLGREVVS